MQLTNLKSDNNLSLLMTLNLYFHWIRLVEVTKVPKFPLSLRRGHWDEQALESLTCWFVLWPLVCSSLPADIKSGINLHLKRKLCRLHVPLNTGESWFNLILCMPYNKAHFCCSLTQRDSWKSEVPRRWDWGSHRPWDSPVSLGSKSCSLPRSSVHSTHSLSPSAPGVR